MRAYSRVGLPAALRCGKPHNEAGKPRGYLKQPLSTNHASSFSRGGNGPSVASG